MHAIVPPPARQLVAACGDIKEVSAPRRVVSVSDCTLRARAALVAALAGPVDAAGLPAVPPARRLGAHDVHLRRAYLGG